MKKRNLALAFGGAVGAAVAVKLLTRDATVNWDDVSDKVMHSEHSHFINVDGTRVHYQEFGDAAKPAMVLIHGYTASVYVWKTVAPMLAGEGFHVIAVDLLGFGYSEKPSWFDYSIQSQARMVSRFMNRLGIGKATIVGSSYGGAVALNLTLDNAESVEKLVLVDAVCNDEPKDHPLLKLASLPGVGETLTPFLLDSKAFLRMRMRGTLAKANHAMITNDRIESIRRPLRAADGHRSVLATSRNWSADRLEQDAHLINQPTLIIWGDSDTVIPIKNGYKLHKEILNSRFVILKDCGHVPQEEKSEIFTELVSEFCHDKKGRISREDHEGIQMAP
ncbi:MAG: alpha/beta hydrolase [Pyrinomonadaceae bacterium]|nr:alpha/beta hydrolase [Acidobacteriota bacterium]MBP7375007.1 alpha/beta hydrolase [Pyrinomonadaceae bacterium]MBP7475750.1 alpha/beta hydrolase [Pyrinomonadaceae bacterium]